MMKRIVVAAVMLVSLNSGTILAVEALDLNKLQADIGRIEACKAKIAGLENSLNGLKIDSHANMWNFIGRSGNEKIIQKRGRIVREISALKNEINSLAAGLLKSRAAVYGNLAAGLSDEGFRQAMAYIDRLAVEDALKSGFMDPKDIESSDRSKERLEFLRYKRDIQDLKRKALETLVKELKAAKKAFQAANAAGQAEVYDKYLQELGDMQAKADKSRLSLDKFLKD